MSFREKEHCLIEKISELGECVVAFSGGVDSALLLAATVKALGSKARAITVHPPYFPKGDLEEAIRISSSLGIKLETLEMEFPEELRLNPEERCYLCKKSIFALIGAQAGTAVVLDGSNADDFRVYRPGIKALSEAAVSSPLAECGFSKKDVRALARAWGLDVWDKPANPCLLTRFPHGTEISDPLLDRVEGAETQLTALGFHSVRVRDHGDLARIELPKEDLLRFCQGNLMEEVDLYLKTLGYRYVSVDLSGYRSGNMDPRHIYSDKGGSSDG